MHPWKLGMGFKNLWWCTNSHHPCICSSHFMQWDLGDLAYMISTATSTSTIPKIIIFSQTKNDVYKVFHFLSNINIHCWHVSCLAVLVWVKKGFHSVNFLILPDCIEMPQIFLLCKTLRLYFSNPMRLIFQFFWADESHNSIFLSWWG